MDDVAELHVSFEPLLLRRIRPEHNERRFYAMVVTFDLFGNVVLIRHWGRIGTGGKQRADCHDDFAKAAKSQERLARTKRRRGYVDHIGPRVELSGTVLLAR